MIAAGQRRWIGRIIKLGLVGLAVLVVLAWIQRRSPVRGDLRVQSDAPAVEAMQAGDVRIFNRDSSVNIILQGDRILAGLSPQTTERIRRELEQSAADDTTGLGGSIAQMVKKTVASTIGMHVVYPLRDIRDIEYRDERLVIIRHDGSTTQLFSNVKTDGSDASRTFSAEDATRFVEAVRARKRSLER